MANSVVNIGQLPNGTAKSVLGVNASGAAIQVPASSLVQGANNLSDLADKSVARGNLGLGTAATLSAGAAGQSLVQAADATAARTALGLPSGSALGFRNRLINGSFAVDQYVRGSTLLGGTSLYIQDRWLGFGSLANKLTFAHYTSGALAGFPNYLGVTTSTAYTPASSEQFVMAQAIEGLNIADLAFGTPSASAVTLSFYVHADVVGTYSGSIRNSAANRSYVFSFPVTVSNTWQRVFVTIPGDTAGTWAADNSVGMLVTFSLGAGAALKRAAGAWAAANAVAAQGSVDLVANAGSHFYVTAVQLEAGAVATPFESRPISTELQLCQRYYWRKSALYEHLGSGSGTAAGQAVGVIGFPVPMRASPTLSCNNPIAGNFYLMGAGGGGIPVANLVFSNASASSAWWTVTVDPGYMSGGQGTFLWSNSATAFISASAEL